MAIIYSYPQVKLSNVSASDLMIISDMNSDSRPTKSLTLGDLASYITSTGTGTGTTNTLTLWSDGPNGVLGDSILAQDALATQLTLTGNFIATGTGNFTGQVTIPITPVDPTDAASKNYVDTEIAGIPAGLVFKGNWDASTNTPALVSGVGTVGNYYVVSVAGNTNLDGITDWEVGDWAVFVEVGGVDKWDKIDQTFVSGNGAAGQVTFWNTINTVDGDNDFYWDNVNKRLGIGNTTPLSALGFSGGPASQIGWDGASNTRAFIGFSRSGNLTRLSFGTAENANPAQERMRIDENGNIGIGTTSPSSKLHVNGVGYFQGGTSPDFGGGTVSNAGVIIEEGDYIYTKDGTSLRKLIGKVSDIIEIGESGTSLVDEIRLKPGNNGFTSFYDDSTETARFTDGKLGIGTTSPVAALDVVGRIGLNDGNDNVSVGDFAGDALTTGTSNIAMGTNALSTETTGARSVAIGEGALQLQNNNNNNYNIAIGHHAGNVITTGAQNTIIGGLAGDALTTGSNNVAVGRSALSAEQQGGRNTAIGYATLLRQNTTGFAYNVAIGYNTGENITTGVGNTLIGGLAGDSITIGSNNAVLGWEAADSLTQGNQNTLVGDQVSGGLTTGSENTYIGRRAASNATTGNNNIAIGAGAALSSATASNEIVLGNGTNNLLRIPGLGATDGHVLTYQAASGGIVLAAGGGGGASSLNDLSDVTLDTTASPNSAYFINIPAGLSGNPNANFVMGAGAGNALTIGEGNTLIGVDAGKSIVDVDFNTMIGYRAGENVDPQTTTGNTFIGYEAGQGALTSTAYGSVAIGYQALENIDGGDLNVCIGALAGESVTNGGQNVMIGYQAGFDHTTNNGATYVGYQAGANANSSDTVAVGARSLYTLSGAWNRHCVVGEDACYATSSNNEHHAFGYQALTAQTTGQRNSAFGAECMELLTTGVDNTAFGHNAGDKLTGDQNTLIGSSAGSSGTNDLTSGDANILIGYNSAASSATISNEVNLYNGSVTARFQGAAAAWSFVSDARDKKDIEDLELGLDFVNKLKPRKFKWDLRDSDVDKNKEASGFIAQEVKEVLDEMQNDYTGIVDTNNPDQYTVSQANIIPMLVKSIQELKAEIELLKSK